MSNSTVTVTANLQFLDPDSGISPSRGLPYGPASFAGTEHTYMQGVMTVPTTAGGTAIPLGPVSAPGDSMFINQDSVNFITIYDAVSGNPISQLDAGKCAMFPFDPSITAPAAKADTATIQMSYMIINRGDVSPVP